jgi:hypothetical protein
LPASALADPTWISADQCDLYFNTATLGGPGGQDLYVATRGQ